MSPRALVDRASELRFIERGASAFVTLTFALVLGLVTTVSGRALAYGSLIRHGYRQCTPCHQDPSGAGVLSAYGRAMADEVVRTRYPGEREHGGDVAPSAGFLWGAFEPPAALLLQADVRYLRLEQKVETVPRLSRNVLMQADFGAGLELDAVAASASIGYADEGAVAAALTSRDEHNVVSRYHWLGYWLLEHSLLLRAGRMNLPFGVRVIEHTLWARSATRTSINDDQQYGLAAAYTDDRVRAELMAVLGNFQLHPDVYRERGYSGYGEYHASDKLSLGASSLLTYRALDPLTLRKTWRQAHGVFARWGTPFEPLVLLAELDYVSESPRYLPRRRGLVGLLQADLELLRGIHVIATGELKNIGGRNAPLSWGSWLSLAWFVLPHVDVRLDSIYQRIGTPTDSVGAATLLLQAHAYL